MSLHCYYHPPEGLIFMTLDEDQALADYLKAARSTTQAEVDALHEGRPLVRYEPHFADAATASAH